LRSAGYFAAAVRIAQTDVATAEAGQRNAAGWHLITRQ
jgi:hypothetical protein